MAQILNRFNQLLQSPQFLMRLIIIAVFIRLVVAFALPLPILSDSGWYADRAVELTQTGSFTKDGHLTAFWPVGYPAVLAVFIKFFFRPIWAGIFINICATVASLLLIPRITSCFIQDQRIGNLAAAFFAFYPAHILYTGQLLTESFYIALILLAFYSFIRAQKLWTYIFAGVLFGLATYVKAQTYLFPVGLCIAGWMVSKRFTMSRTMLIIVAVYFGIAVTIAPWSYRNYEKLGSFVMMSTNGGSTLYDGNNPLSTGGYSGFPLGPLYETFLPTLPILPDQYDRQEVAWDKLTRKMAVAWIKENPSKFILAMPKKAFFLWRSNADAFVTPELAYPERYSSLFFAKVLSYIYYLVILSLSIWAGVLALRQKWRTDDAHMPIALLYTFPVFTTLIAMVFSGQSRFNLPCIPFLMIAAAWVLYQHFSRGMTEK
jgi:Dolichyl-phosphate-mannose-protein mannosyltransferase